MASAGACLSESVPTAGPYSQGGKPDSAFSWCIQEFTGMFYNHTEAWGIVWGPPKCTLCHGKCFGACNGWQLVLDMWRDSVTCRQVATFSETKYYVPVVTGKPAGLETFSQ